MNFKELSDSIREPIPDTPRPTIADYGKEKDLEASEEIQQELAERMLSEVKSNCTVANYLLLKNEDKVERSLLTDSINKVMNSYPFVGLLLLSEVEEKYLNLAEKELETEINNSKYPM